MLNSRISPRPARIGLLTGVLATTTGALYGCADKVDEADAQQFKVTADDQTCEVSGDTAETGTASFDVTNNGSKVTEFYTYTDAGRVVGEVENIGPGATRKLVVQLTDPGDYTLTCKPVMVGEGISQPLTVTGEAIDVVEGDEAAREAVHGYLSYVRNQTQTLKDQPKDFTAAIEEGDIDKAKELFPIVRTPYERIEPVAESFPDGLDPRIDVREADLEEGQEWTGFHKIEKQLFDAGKITDQTKKDAQQLEDDLAELVDGVSSDDFTFTPVQIASGAQGLLDEIATSKITGEEDIFSGTDLYDFQANLDGSKAAIASLEKVIDDKAPQLLSDINDRFDDVQKLLDKYREGDGFVDYNDVDQNKRRELSDSIDVLTEKVARVQEVVAQ